MIPVEEIAVMLSTTLINLFISLLMFVGSLVISLRISSWRTLLMIAGSIIALSARTTHTVVGYLEMAGVVNNALYQKYRDLAYAIGTTGNLIAAIGFLAVAVYIFRRLTPMAQKDSVTL